MIVLRRVPVVPLTSVLLLGGVSAGIAPVTWTLVGFIASLAVLGSP